MCTLNYILEALNWTWFVILETQRIWSQGALSIYIYQMTLILLSCPLFRSGKYVLEFLLIWPHSAMLAWSSTLIGLIVWYCPIDLIRFNVDWPYSQTHQGWQHGRGSAMIEIWLFKTKSNCSFLSSFHASFKTSQELRMLSNVTLNCQETKTVSASTVTSLYGR